MSALGVCLVLAAAGTGGAPVFVPTEHFTLAWTHSIEKQRWEEDYAVQPGDSPAAAPRLQATAARVRGSAAGMEPPEGARRVGGWYEYTPPKLSPGVLRLMRSEFTADYVLCIAGRCAALSSWLPSDGGVTLLSACRGDPAR
jgi:hypothetical protein